MIQIVYPSTDIILKNICPRTPQGPVDVETTQFYFRLSTTKTPPVNDVLIPSNRLVEGNIYISKSELSTLTPNSQLTLTHFCSSAESTLDDNSYDSIFVQILPYYLKQEKESEVSESIVNKVVELEGNVMLLNGRVEAVEASTTATLEKVEAVEATATSTLEGIERLDASVNDILAALPNYLIVGQEDWLDCNTFRINGFTRTNPESVNCPPECFGHYGMLLWVSKSDDDVTGIQVYVDYSGGGEQCKTFIRRYSRTNDEWGNWYRYANEIDIQTLKENIDSVADGAQEHLSDAANQLWTVYHELNGRTDTLSDAVTDLQYQIDNLPTGGGSGSGPADTTELEKTLAFTFSDVYKQIEDNELTSAKAIASISDQLAGVNETLESI